MIFRNEDHDLPSPLDEANMLQSLYFPDLAEELLAIQHAQLPLLKFIGAQRIRRLEDQDAWLKAWDQNPYNEAYKTYLMCIGKFTNKCRSKIGTNL